MAEVAGTLDAWRRRLQAAGPYLLIELLLPGGTLVALAVYLWRRGGVRGGWGVGAGWDGALRVLATRGGYFARGCRWAPAPFDKG